MRRAAPLPALAAALLIPACAGTGGGADALARAQAKQVVNGILARRLPGVNAAQVTDCIIDAASAPEIIAIARATVTGVTRSTVQQVVAIARRPESVQCIAQNSPMLPSL